MERDPLTVTVPVPAQGERELDLVTLPDVKRTPNFLWQRELRRRAQPRPGARVLP